MTATPRIEWKRAPDFAEIAEALRVPTDQIMAAHNPTSRYVVALFTLGEPEPTLVYSARLRRDSDDVLHLDSVPKPHPGMWEAIVARMENES